MNLTKNIKFKNFFKLKNSRKKIQNILLKLLNEKNQILNSLSKSYKDTYNKKDIQNYRNYSNIIIIGMGG